MAELSEQQIALIKNWRVARLATADSDGLPHVVPICFAFEGKCFYSVLDKKPKSIPATQLKRVRNILANSNVSLVLDHYDEVWGSLWYILISGTAELVPRGPEQQNAIGLLQEKYRQYRAMEIGDSPVIKVIPHRITMWGNLPVEEI